MREENEGEVKRVARTKRSFATISPATLVIAVVLVGSVFSGWLAARTVERRRAEAADSAARTASEAARPSFTARLEPSSTVDQGDYLVLRVEARPGRVITRCEASVFGQDLMVYPLERIVVRPATGGIRIGRALFFARKPPPETQHVFYAAFAIGSARKAGQYELALRVTDSRGEQETESLSFTVREKNFEVQRLTVTGQIAALASDDSAWAYDREKVTAAKAVSAPRPLWDGDFIRPVDGAISTEFGQIRFVNGIETGRHSGLDIEARMGTPVKATNAGVVVFAGPLKISGNTVIIDHGLGYFSSYNHLSKISVKPHDPVAKGQVIGLVGSTGFSTSAHLHWTMTVGLTGVSPWLFVGHQPPLPFPDQVDPAN